jgi:ribosomal protein S18 acetylase RimI-like enzyme
MVEPFASSTEITVRPATPRDAEAITRIYLESADHHAGLDAGRFYIPEAEEISARYRETQQHPPGAQAITLLAEVDSEIVGFVDVRLTRSPDPMHREMLYCYIVEIATSRHHYGRGVGAKLMGAAEDWGRQQNAELAMLEYLVTNQRAAALYERLGYRPASITAIKRL